MDGEGDSNPANNTLPNQPVFRGIEPQTVLQRTPPKNDQVPSTSQNTTSLSPRRQRCSHCDTFLDRSENEVCYCNICNKKYHISCVTSNGVDEKTILLAKKKTTNTLWVCNNCRGKFKTMGNTIEFANQNPEHSEMQRLLDIEKEKLKNQSNEVENENKRLKKINNELTLQVDGLKNIIHNPMNVSEQEARLIKLENELINFKKREAEHHAIQKKLRDELMEQKNKNDSTGKRTKTDILDERIDDLENKIESLINTKFVKFTNAIENVLEKIVTNQTISTHQPRTTIRNISASEPRGKSHNRQDRKTYAEMLSKTEKQTECYKNIVINVEDPITFEEDLQNSHSFDDIKIASIKTKNENLITVKCADKTEADKLVKKLALR